MSGQSASEKTEQPTQKRLRDARKRGQVVRSVDVVTTIGTSGVLFALLIMFPDIAARISGFLESCLYAASYRSTDTVVDIANQGIRVLGAIILPLAIVTVVFTVFGNIIQFGFVMAFEAMKPSMDKLNPFNGLKRIFSMKGLLEFTKSLIKLCLLCVVVTWVIVMALGPVLLIPFGGLPGVWFVAEGMMRGFLIAVLLAYVVISIVDYLLQRMLLTKDLMMTKDEVKRENKDSEGDPLIKGNRRQLARELIMEDAPTATRKSTVLVTNPTHYAVGLYFQAGETPLPKVRVKASGILALRLRQVAHEAGVPVVENVPLAHSLYERLEVNDFVPGDLIEPTAQILRWVATLPRKNP